MVTSFAHHSSSSSAINRWYLNSQRSVQGLQMIANDRDRKASKAKVLSRKRC